MFLTAAAGKTNMEARPSDAHVSIDLQTERCMSMVAHRKPREALAWFSGVCPDAVGQPAGRLITPPSSSKVAQTTTL